MFEKSEAFEYIKNFLQIENAEETIVTDRRALLDEITFNIQSKLPFQNISLLSVHPSKRRKPTRDEMKANYLSGVGGLCFDLNISTYYLLSAIGFDVSMAHTTVSTSIVFKNNHVALIVHSLEQEGDQFLVDVACGSPTLQAISLDFEKESPIYVNSYLEYKFVKYEGKLLRMHRKGCGLAMRGRQENSETEFWIGDWRRFYDVDLNGTKDSSKFEEYHEAVYINPKSSPFHISHRVVTYTGGKAAMVVNDKTLIENDKGELVSTVLEGGDEGIKSAIKQICPAISQELLSKSLLHWRQTTENKA